MTDSKATRASRKAQVTFPLWVHKGTGSWCKKVRGQFHYFGSVAADPQGEKALAVWLAQKDDLQAGRKPRQTPQGSVTVSELCRQFLEFKDQARDAGEIGARTYNEYFETAKLACKHFGNARSADDLQPADFQSLRAKMAKRWGPVRLGNEIQRTRMIFRYGIEAGILGKPMLFGPGFDKPSAKVIRKAKAETGPREFSVEDLRRLRDAAGPNMRAMILLGINGGLGNTDLAALKLKSLKLDSGWLDYPRQKTGIGRRIPLWPETVKALREMLAARREPKDKEHAGFAFISPRGLPYEVNHRTYGLTAEFIRLCKLQSVKGRTFYDLRRTFQTIAEGCHDLVAVQAIMGHAPRTNDMSAVYRQRVDDSRLLNAVKAVHDWLYIGCGQVSGGETLAG
jgi:integrase